MLGMINNSVFISKLFAAVGCGLTAGVFFAFSTFVMAALAKLPAAQGLAAMQAINITVINPWFMTVFLGTAFLSIFLVISALVKWQQPGSVYLLIGSLLYLVGTFLVTIAFNVPLNEALANANPNSTSGTELWAKYLVQWTNWNHLRTIAALLATVLFLL
jgi:uncharacterized membrane protein